MIMRVKIDAVNELIADWILFDHKSQTKLVNIRIIYKVVKNIGYTCESYWLSNQAFPSKPAFFDSWHNSYRI